MTGMTASPPNPASTTPSASRVPRASPSCTTIPVHISTPWGTSTARIRCSTTCRRPSRWARRMAMPRASFKWSGAACCWILPPTRAPTRCRSTIGSPPRICKTPRRRKNVEIRKGDILLVRTGWRKTWGEPDDAGRLDAAHTKWHRPQPGIGPDCLKFLNETEIVAIGSDNAAVEWGFPAKPDYNRKAFGFLGLPLHVDFIWNRGAYIMEILNLDDLAKDRAYEFFFVLGPLLKGGIGVPINPVAIL